MASDGEELVRFITEKMVVAMDRPRTAERERPVRQPWSQRWFGMLPLGWSVWRASREERRR
ncbi:YqzE family protein [Paenibacillus glufosinatiresistens]|uniref:YqzE family protein n=1 Tax=Paenibacillus glufosinatiresistens TaxID=3070657 RepID=UPI00286DB331|nr:YqzE family protein [Paenibacillus sp. YX.27]